MLLPFNGFKVLKDQLKKNGPFKFFDANEIN